MFTSSTKMLSLGRTRSRLLAAFVLLALAFAVIPAAGDALASTPAQSPGKQASSTGLAGKAAPQQADRPQSSALADKDVTGNPPGKPIKPNDIVLYDQYDNPGTNATNSQNYETPNDAFDDQLADDFTVCCGSGATWTINEVDVSGAYYNGNPPPGGPARDFHVYFYSDNGGLPGSQIADRDLQAYTNNGVNFAIAIGPAVNLPLGHYWISVQANMDFGAPDAGQWGWSDRTVTSGSPAAWQNPGDGFGSCPAWAIRYNCVTPTSTEPDQMFRLVGTTTGSTATPTSIPTATYPPGCTDTGWVGGPYAPSPVVRAVGVWIPATEVGSSGRFYTMGGRSADDPSANLINPTYFNPASGIWTVATASFPDNQVSNMACADLNGPAGHRIYCVGGSTSAVITATNRVAVYNPVTDTFNPNDDVWPGDADGITIPGGFAVVSNTLYILGGFRIGTGMSQQIWQFDPNAPSGSRWVHKNALVPDPNGGGGLGYIPAAAIGNIIYTAGGSHWNSDTNSIADDPTAFSYDTVNDVVDDRDIPDLPSPGSAETRALTVDPGYGHRVIWLIGGGRTSPNPSADVLELDPSWLQRGWREVSYFDKQGRRNFPVDTNGLAGSNLRIYLAGGYSPGCCERSMRVYDPSLPWCYHTPGPTNTYTPTDTPTYTRTVSPTPICPTSWTQQTQYPAHIMDEAITAQGGILYSFSGVVTGTIHVNSYKYNPNTNTWTAIAPLPGPRENPSAVSDGTYIYILGGNDDLGNITSSLWRYDPSANTYITLTNALVATRAQTAAYLGGKIYKIGGTTASAVTNDAEAYDIASDTWSILASYPQSVAFPMAAGLNGYLYVAGGEDGAVGITNTYRYDPTTNIWSDAGIADLPRDSWGAASDVLQGEWVIAGGFAPVNDDITQGVLSWDPGTNTWSPIDTMLQPRGRLAGGTIANAFYAIGGATPPFSFNGSTDNQRYINICPPQGVVNGHLTWQYVAAADRPSITGTLSICVNGAPRNYNFTTDTNGNFALTTNLPDGVYHWQVRGGRHISSASGGGNPDLIISGGVATQEFGTQKGGDTDASNTVNSTDFNTLKSQFGQSGSRSADFDYNMRVNASDFDILKTNFGRGGLALTCP